MKKHWSNWRVRILVAAVLGVGLLIQIQRSLSQRQGDSPSIVVRAPSLLNQAVAAPPAPGDVPAESLERRAARDPMGFMEYCLERYDRSVRDYTCTFSKQELLGRKLSTEQVMNVSFREKPFSVRMEWVKNEDKCSRVLYVADRWLENGKQMAVVEPGAIARLFVPYVMREIEGAEAQKTSRRTINQFGVRNAMLLVLKYCKMAREQKVLEFKYTGNGEVGGRATLVFERRLPYTDDRGIWPDRVLVVHMDRELLVPLLCASYADDQCKVLLGKYVTSDLKLNVNLPDSVFTKEGMGL